MERIDLKIKGKSGPFALRLFSTKEVIEIGQKASDGQELHEQYRDIAQMSLVYEKSGRNVYSPKQKDKMDKEIGGGKIVSLAQQAMVINGLMEDSEFDAKLEEAEKN